MIDKQQFGITIRFQSQHNNELWKLTNVYGPCDEPDRTIFINWFRNHQVGDEENWIFLGDFNFYRSVKNRNRAGGNINDTLILNDAIRQLGLVELPLKGRSYTWSNMQINPLLEQLDWYFTSINWTLDYPNTEVLPLAKITSDHLPCLITIGTKIPKASVFRFENYWAERPDFLEVVQSCWTSCRGKNDRAQNITAKLKSLRTKLKAWSRNISNLKLLITNCNEVIGLLDHIDDHRGLYNPEANLRIIIKRQIKIWHRYKTIYWKNRYTVNRVKYGDECTKFFHGMATISYR